MTQPATAPTGSKGRGLLHVTVILFAYLVISAIVATALGLDTQASAHFAGRPIIVVVLLAYVASLLYRKGHRVWAGLLALVLCTAMPVSFFLLSRSARVSEAERRDLDISPEGIRHRDFHFVLPHPGQGFHPIALPTDSVQRLMAKSDSAKDDLRGVAFWLLRNDTSSEALIVLAGKMRIENAEDLRKVREGFQGPVRRIADAPVLEDTVVWEPGDHEVRFAARVGEAGYWRIRCLASLSGPDILVCAATWSPKADGLDFVRNGLRFESSSP